MEGNLATWRGKDIYIREMLQSYEVNFTSFKEHLALKGYAKQTIVLRVTQLQPFLSFVGKPLRAISSKDLMRYLRLLQDRGASLSWQEGVISVLKQFFRFLEERGVILLSPAKRLKYPKRGVILPGAVITQEQMNTFIFLAGEITEKQKRNRALFELMYSTGLRSGEVINLNVNDLYLNDGLVYVHQGKGQKDRVVPLGQKAVMFYRDYVKTRKHPHSKAFTSVSGKSLTRQGLGQILLRHSQETRIKVTLTPLEEASPRT